MVRYFFWYAGQFDMFWETRGFSCGLVYGRYLLLPNFLGFLQFRRLLVSCHEFENVSEVDRPPHFQLCFKAESQRTHLEAQPFCRWLHVPSAACVFWHRSVALVECAASSLRWYRSLSEFF